jgi:hypothetical protein
MQLLPVSMERIGRSIRGFLKTTSPGEIEEERIVS